MPTSHVTSGTKFSHADLAFIDAAIQMQKAITTKVAAGEATLNNSVKVQCDPVDVVALLAAAAVIAYHAYNSCVIADDAATVARLTGVNVNVNASLDDLIAKRNKFAAALGMKNNVIRG